MMAEKPWLALTTLNTHCVHCRDAKRPKGVHAVYGAPLCGSCAHKKTGLIVKTRAQGEVAAPTKRPGRVAGSRHIDRRGRSRRRRGCRVDSPKGQVAATPRVPRG